MAEDNTTAVPADGATAPVDDVVVDSVAAIDGAAKPAAEAAPNADPAEGAEGDKPDAGGEDGGDKPKRPQRLPEWAEKKLAEAEFEKREARRQLKEAEDKLARQTPAPTPAIPNAADDAAARANAPAGGYATQADFDAAVAAEADRRAAADRQNQTARELRQKIDAAWEAGVKAYGAEDFTTIGRNLQTVGFVPVTDQAGNIVSNTDLMDLVLETEDPAKVLFELGSDPSRAATLMALSPAKRAFEIARLSQPAPKKPTQLSKAPPPVPQIEGTSRVTAAPVDDDDDDTFFRKREAELRASGRW